MSFRDRWAVINNMAGSILGFAFLFGIAGLIALHLTGVPEALMREYGGDEPGARQQATLIYGIIGATVGAVVGVFVGRGAAKRKLGQRLASPPKDDSAAG